MFPSPTLRIGTASGSSCTVPSAKDLASVTASHTEERQEASEGRDSSIAESSEVALRPGPPLSPLRVRSQAHAEPNMLGSRKASKEAKKGKSPDKQPSNGESLISSRSASSGSLEPPTPFLMISASNSISQLADDTYESNDNKASRPQSLLPGQMPLGAKSEPKGDPSPAMRQSLPSPMPPRQSSVFSFRRSFPPPFSATSVPSMLVGSHRRLVFLASIHVWLPCRHLKVQRICGFKLISVFCWSSSAALQLS